MQYFFIRTDGLRLELTKEQCYSWVAGITGLDEVMITICLNKDGIQHPTGKWIKEDYKMQSMKAKSTIYQGIRVTPDEKTGSDSLVYVDNKPLDPKPSQKIMNHSPDGFNWGYGGSGPAQLALAILLDYYGKDSSVLHFYQQFKFLVIANLPQESDWKLTGEQIEEEIRAIQQLKKEG